MRITAQMIIDSAIKHMEENRTRLFDIQEAVSSGKRFSRPSQDPMAAAKSMEINGLLDRLDQYERSVDSSTAFLEETERALNGTYDLVVEAWEISLGFATTGDSEGRQIAASQIGLLRDQLLAQANARIGDRYVFGGYSTGSQPFASDGTYNGDSGLIQIRIGTSSNMTLNFTGDEVFKGGTGGVDIFHTLEDFQTALENNDQDGIDQARAELAQAIDQIVSFQSQTGVRLKRLETAKTDLADSRFQMSDLLADTESADITKVAAELAVQQTLFQASVAATSKVLQISLLSLVS